MLEALILAFVVFVAAFGGAWAFDCRRRRRKLEESERARLAAIFSRSKQAEIQKKIEAMRNA